ncbi:hypothetical protein ATANTOWER_002176 [Ataeniobius toweri]|uniref:Uncharacterized protein n=1 Tax=Ataeniobius toweri TaxID=208326 RepID=A0ABU7C5R6_9TELE|nr:hypothetical protein [Ataeniobius toweri]
MVRTPAPSASVMSLDKTPHPLCLLMVVREPGGADCIVASLLSVCPRAAVVNTSQYNFPNQVCFASKASVETSFKIKPATRFTCRKQKLITIFITEKRKTNTINHDA